MDVLGRLGPTLVAGALIAAMCGWGTSGIGSAPAAAGSTATILIAGDIAGPWNADSKTAAIIAGIPGIVMTAGDDAYFHGSRHQFNTFYDPTWGQFKDRTYPVPGNHEWLTEGARGYFEYFGDRAGPAGRGYYDFDAGPWRVYAMTGDCGQIGGCGKHSPEYQWLKAHLAADTAACTLAVWHEPRFSSGPHGDDPAVAPLLKLLYTYGAEVVVNGHDHLYERFAPTTPDGVVDKAYGIRRFTVGTGGAAFYPIERQAPASRVQQNSSHGVLKLTLSADGYTWEFLPVLGEVFHETGSGKCHGAPA